MGKYSLTVQDSGSSKEFSYESEEKLLRSFSSRFSAKQRNKGDWTLGVLYHEEGFDFDFSKTSDGFLFMFSSYKTPYQDFPDEVLGTLWIYKFGDADKPCHYLANGDAFSYFPQCFYIPLSEAKKLLQTIKEKGMKNAFSYDPDCWKNAAEEAESLELASEEIQRQALGDHYLSFYPEDDDDDE